MASHPMTHTKAARHSRIEELIRANVVTSQAELVEHLRADGMNVTQATLSRDLEELHAVKVRGAYVIPPDNDRPLRPAEEPPARLMRLLRRTCFANGVLDQVTSHNVGLSDANLSKRELCERIAAHVPGFVFFDSPIGQDPDQRNYIVSNARIEVFSVISATNPSFPARSLVRCTCASIRPGRTVLSLRSISSPAAG